MLGWDVSDLLRPAQRTPSGVIVILAERSVSNRRAWPFVV